jgi:hypothetical protein
MLFQKPASGVEAIAHGVNLGAARRAASPEVRERVHNGAFASLPEKTNGGSAAPIPRTSGSEDQ